MRILLCLLLVLAACSRPLTENEVAFAEDLYGPSLDTSNVRVSLGLGILPPPKLKKTGVRVLVGTDKACVRTPQPRGAQPPQAFALRNGLHFDPGLYSDDMALGWPKARRFPQTLIFAHELAHVWQWQNRETTGYSAFRAIMESVRLADPYFSASGAHELFYRFGYEQQAAIIEDYLCFTFANPHHPRRAELRAVLEPVLPLDRFDEVVRTRER
ncbi:MAG: hypothetical protein GKR98_01230 [Boseongicola sp.]|nr:MAG: hypothetical protein GKR98_01230 [Boseongicola sp.]